MLITDTDVKDYVQIKAFKIFNLKASWKYKI